MKKWVISKTYIRIKEIIQDSELAYFLKAIEWLVYSRLNCIALKACKCYNKP
jgi:hypothetical protein